MHREFNKNTQIRKTRFQLLLFYYLAEKEILLRAEESYSHLSTWHQQLWASRPFQEIFPKLVTKSLSGTSNSPKQNGYPCGNGKKNNSERKKNRICLLSVRPQVFFSPSLPLERTKTLSLSRSFSRAGWSSETDKRKGSKRRKPWIPFSFLISFLLHLPFARCPRSPTSADLLLAFSLLALFLPSASVDLSDLLLQRPRAVPWCPIPRPSVTFSDSFPPNCSYSVICILVPDVDCWGVCLLSIRFVWNGAELDCMFSIR